MSHSASINVPSDESLAQQASIGNQQAFRELMERHLPRVYAFCAGRCGHSIDVEDVCQEIFVSVHKSLPRYDAERPFATWLWVIVRRTLIDFFRKVRPEVTSDDELMALKADPRPLPDENVASSDAAHQLWAQAHELLPQAQATALWLRVQEEHSLEEIAVIMGKTATHIKVMLFRARQTLALAWRDRTTALQEPFSLSSQDSTTI